MSKVRIRAIDGSDDVALPPVAGVSLSPGVRTRPVFDNFGMPLVLYRHDLRAGDALALARPAAGHLIFVWSGSLAVKGSVVGAGSVVSVAHHAAATLEAREDDTSLLHFFSVEASSEEKDGKGGCVHIIPAETVQRRFDPERDLAHSIYLDSSCEHCRLWLHRTTADTSGYYVPPHYHSEDEIIVITDGQMQVGARFLGVGGAIAIAERAAYSFRAGPEGLSFINFRNADPYYALAGAGDQGFFSERALLQSLAVTA